MAISPLAGKKAPANILIDPAALERDYYDHAADFSRPEQMVIFGTSGHRGTPILGGFTEAHILAITQAVCDYRRSVGIDGPIFVGKDTHLLSGPAQRTALEVLAANQVSVILQAKDQFTPTPVISRAILAHNRGRTGGLADGLIITPSHNPPGDGGIKYNPPEGGPADSGVTTKIQNRANELLLNGNRAVKRIPYERALAAPTTRAEDFAPAYVDDLRNVIDIDAIRGSGLRLGVDPLGGASVRYWELIRDVHRLDLKVVNDRVDPTFAFMTVDHDGKIRMDCSSAYAMAGLIAIKDDFALAFGNDADADRHGIVLPGTGLLNPNHYLAVAIQYLLGHREDWNPGSFVGKTLVSSAMIDRVVADCGRVLREVPVGFKWFAPGLFDGTCCFGGEESAGASFLRSDGTVWTTDKDGIILDLLAAEITARTGKNPGLHYADLTGRFGNPSYTRIDAPATIAQKARLAKLSPADVSETRLAGEEILEKLTQAPGNQAPIGGLKIVTKNGWFAARPSGTEDIYKIYAESFLGDAHLAAIVEEAQRLVTNALR